MIMNCKEIRIKVDRAFSAHAIPPKKNRREKRKDRIGG